MEKLSQKQCVPGRKDMQALDDEQKLKLKEQLHEDWTLTQNNSHLERKFKTKNFKQAWDLLNLAAQVAEEQNHHPELRLGWGYLEIEIWTHTISNLVESDFILAAKYDELS
jgi:4a-hydroxytetrahydrobiopterin dehydratase